MIFSLLQLKNVYFDSWLEIISIVLGVITILSFPIFLLWIIKADVLPTKDYIVIKEPRSLFATYKKAKKKGKQLLLH